MKKIIISILLVILVVCFSTGCGGPELPTENPTALAIIIGSHSNSKKYNVQIYDEVKKVYSKFGNVCIITVDGNPSAMRDEENKIIGYYEAEYMSESKETYKYQEIWERNRLNPQIKKVEEAVESSCADDPEIDTLEALHIASDLLNMMEENMIDSDETESEKPKSVKKEIIVYDTGLCTQGALNFLDEYNLELLSGDKSISMDDEKTEKLKELISNLNEIQEIPDLVGVSVKWYGMGETVEPQPSLSKVNKNNLKLIWQEILKESGVNPLKTDDNNNEYNIFNNVDGYGTYPSKQYVSLVVPWNDIGENNNSMEIKFTEEKIGFKGNSSDFKDAKDAKSVLLPYAENLKLYPYIKILLVGTTSSYNGGSVYLSEQRAQKIMDTFVELGVPKERLEAIGLGYDLDFCKNDSPQGNFEEDIGKENRAVFIYPIDSEKAIQALNKK